MCWKLIDMWSIASSLTRLCLVSRVLWTLGELGTWVLHGYPDPRPNLWGWVGSVGFGPTNPISTGRCWRRNSNPILLAVLATSGIDYDIKLWAPLEGEPVDRSKEIADLVERNKLMLEETRDTVTIPAAFMLRMIAAMNRYRRGKYRHFGEKKDMQLLSFAEHNRGGSDEEDSDSS